MSSEIITVSLDSKLIDKKSFDQSSLTIGRDLENDIQINNLAVSRYHAIISKQNEKYYIKDLGSSNGTFINGNKVTTSEFDIGDLILIGKHVIRLEKVVSSQQSEYIEDHTIMVDSATQQKFLDKLQLEKQEPEDQEPKPSRLILSNQVEILIENEIFSIGKKTGSNLLIDGFLIKEEHANIIKQPDGRYRIVSYGSFLKPTKINGLRINDKILTSGDIIQIGKHKMVYLS